MGEIKYLNRLKPKVCTMFALKENICQTSIFHHTMSKSNMSVLF